LENHNVLNIVVMNNFRVFKGHAHLVVSGILKRPWP